MTEKELESPPALRGQLGSPIATMRMLRDTLADVGGFLDSVAEALDADAQDGGIPSARFRDAAVPALLISARPWNTMA